MKVEIVVYASWCTSRHHIEQLNTTQPLAVTLSGTGIRDMWPSMRMHAVRAFVRACVHACTLAHVRTSVRVQLCEHMRARARMLAARVQIMRACMHVPACHRFGQPLLP